MKGYRTVIANALFSLITTGAVQYSSLPPDAQHLLTILSLAWGFVGIFLRLVTNTPVGQKLEAEIERDFGLTADQMNQLLSKLPQKADLNALGDQFEKILAVVNQPAPAPAPAGTPAAPAG